MRSAYLKLIITIVALQMCGLPSVSDFHVIRKQLKSNKIKTIHDKTLPFDPEDQPLLEREEAFQLDNVVVFGPQNQNSEPQKLQAYQEKKWFDTCPASGFHFSNQSLVHYQSLDTEKHDLKPKKGRRNKIRTKISPKVDRNIQFHADEGSDRITKLTKTHGMHNLELQTLINDFLENFITLKALLDQLKGENNELEGKRIETRGK